MLIRIGSQSYMHFPGASPIELNVEFQASAFPKLDLIWFAPGGISAWKLCAIALKAKSCKVDLQVCIKS